MSRIGWGFLPPRPRSSRWAGIVSATSATSVVSRGRGTRNITRSGGQLDGKENAVQGRDGHRARQLAIHGDDAAIDQTQSIQGPIQGPIHGPILGPIQGPIPPPGGPTLGRTSQRWPPQQPMPPLQAGGTLTAPCRGIVATATCGAPAQAESAPLRCCSGAAPSGRGEEAGAESC